MNRNRKHAYGRFSRLGREILPRSARSRLVLAAFAGLAAFSLVSCDLFTYKRPFPDEYYTSNFIAGRGLDQFSGADPASSIPLDGNGDYIIGTGTWDLAYRYDTDWDGFNYITRTLSPNPASFYGTADGLDPSSEVYLVEVKNLIQAGNFETDESAAWTATTSGSDTAAATWDTTIVQLFGSGNERLDIDKTCSLTYVTTAAAGFPGFSSTASYNLFFRYYSQVYSARYNVDGSSTYNSLNNTTAKAAVTYTINNGYASPPEITFSPINDVDATLYNFYADNFRVGRNGNMELRLYLTRTQTDPELESGTYSFSVWACPDPDSYDWQNPYLMDKFAVKMVAGTGTGYLASTTATYSGGSGWRKYTATLKPGALTFDDSTKLPVLGLVLDFNSTKPGSVLIAQPELRFYPDGL